MFEQVLDKYLANEYLNILVIFKIQFINKQAMVEHFTWDAICTPLKILSPTSFVVVPRK